MGFVVVLLLLAAAGWYAIASVRTVPSGQVGLVTKRFDLRPRRSEDDSRVSAFDGAGPQARVLRANTRTWLPRYVYDVELIPPTYVPNGTIGLVVAKAGAVSPPGSQIAKYVECDYFQDGVRFLRGGGEQGRQLQVLTGGYYDINTHLFQVITVDTPEAMEREGLTPRDLAQVEISIGETGVVVTHLGAKTDPNALGPRVDGHAAFQLPWEFLARGGHRGVQAETLDEAGHYAINPWFASVVEIPTRVLILEWTKGEKTTNNLDISLGQIVLDVQGHTVRLDMKQTVRIPAKAAPGIVRSYGLGGRGEAGGRSTVQEFVNKQLAATVDGYFRKISAGYRIQEFITRYDEVGNQLAGEVRQAMAPTGVEAISTTLANFECDEPGINDMRRQIALQQERVKLEQAKLAELHAMSANAEVRNEIALQEVKVEDERRQLDFIELRTLVKLLGAEHVSMERVLAQWVKVNVPQYIGGTDGGVAQALLQAMPFTQARDMLMSMANEAAKGVPGADSDPPELANGNPDQNSRN
jgi:regulator of protease activity HflC (stomatin/prohibitin superfamily)